VRRQFDPLGAVTVTGGLVLLVYALSKAPAVGWAAASTVTLFAAAAALLVAFVVIESRAAAPLMPLRIFRSRALAGANIAGLLIGGSFFGFIFIGTLYMQQVLGYSALQTGLAWLVASLTSVAMAGIAQTLVTRISAGPVLIFGMALVGGGALWAAQVPMHTNFWLHLAGPFFVAGAGTAFGFIPISIAGLQGVAEHEAGLASGLLNTSQQLGGAIGVAIASTVTATRVKTLTAHGKTADVALTGGFHWAFWVCGLIALLALPTTAVLMRRTPATQDKPITVHTLEAVEDLA
jgi:MFS family permease